MVEDNTCDQQLTLEALKKNNVSNPVDIVNDGAEALDYLHKRGNFSDRTTGDPAVVLLDIQMPNIDGFEVLRQTKKNALLKTIPIVILSSSQEEHDIAKSYELGANAYVVKPVNYDDFSSVLTILGIFWTKLNEAP
ncbi:MAG: response regulator [bacterium]|nr:response regulator [bacterium]